MAVEAVGWDAQSPESDAVVAFARGVMQKVVQLWTPGSLYCAAVAVMLRAPMAPSSSPQATATSIPLSDQSPCSRPRAVARSSGDSQNPPTETHRRVSQLEPSPLRRKREFRARAWLPCPEAKVVVARCSASTRQSPSDDGPASTKRVAL